ncbi:hypothetical protein HRG_006506 [Hirsutella rhossiliensis]|uniref:Uncharacterized protein n=1 Tax=Hirsutella rhossiliensis TaxID=111463 RepID=A0A9P8SHQ6_9HYPO|nr:uncharacterized protein HRG_06506 [Hirsutella rhossiliensis]KAH0962404.1 hypothetical protein HRG_06506 [Hirsutella rhossiliensis]
MAPVRRYLRISKYSVLECRIYLDNPALAQSWLLNPRDPILPRVIESIRPLVLPKLREEKERGKKKSSKKKGIKDVIVQDDFEVSMFLTETSTRHSLLTKHKHFREKAPPTMQSNSTRLIGETDLVPVDVDAETAAPVLREQDSDDEGPRLAAIRLPETRARRKRQRNVAISGEDGESADDDGAASAIEIDSDADEPAPKRPRGVMRPDDDDDDDKKKMAMDVSYDGFAIYGRVLCLVVKRRDGKAQPARSDARGSKSAGQGQARMENWISSTQMPVGEEVP